MKTTIRRLMVGFPLVLISPLTLAQQAATTGQASPLAAPAPACVFTLAKGSQPQCPALMAPAKAGLIQAGGVTVPAAGGVAPAAATEPATALVPAQAAAPKDYPSWDLRLQDVTLASALARWAKTAGWRVLWDLDKHLLIDSPDTYLGSFEQVVTALLSSPSLANSSVPLEVCFYPNTPPLARITRRGDQHKDCK